MNTGVVVSFYGRKGYGFIKPDGSEEHLFVHQSEIQKDGYRTLREGQKVKFSVVVMNDGRTKAITVTPVDKIIVKKNRKQRNGKTNGGVDNRVCYNCGCIGHLCRDCTSVVLKRRTLGCYKCGESDHVARECDREINSNDDGGCYKCGVIGHQVLECPMETGEVVCFYGPRGYGFIRPDEAGEDLFVHQSEILSDGYRTLRKGQGVRFMFAEKDGRRIAVKVTPVDKIL